MIVQMTLVALFMDVNINKLSVMTTAYVPLTLVNQKADVFLQPFVVMTLMLALLIPVTLD
jgi:hypothetical protein